jgi:hypothetical protein
LEFLVTCTIVLQLRYRFKMLMSIPFSLVIVISFLAVNVYGECANACNGHGRCTSYDMCICNRNWQANDCSERICQFALAHVDTPKVLLIFLSCLNISFTPSLLYT